MLVKPWCHFHRAPSLSSSVEPHRHQRPWRFFNGEGREEQERHDGFRMGFYFSCRLISCQGQGGLHQSHSPPWKRSAVRERERGEKNDWSHKLAEAKEKAKTRVFGVRYEKDKPPLTNTMSQHAHALNKRYGTPVSAPNVRGWDTVKRKRRYGLVAPSRAAQTQTSRARQSKGKHGMAWHGMPCHDTAPHARLLL